MSENLQLIPGTLATNCYPASPQALYNEMFQRGSALADDTNSVIISDTEPDPEDRDKGWIKLVAPGGRQAIPYVLKWISSAWVAPHPYEPESPVRLFWVGTTAELVTFDGGSASGSGETGGPMWEVDTDFEGRVPIGVGTLDGRTLAPTSLAVGEETGESEHTQTESELVSHYHTAPTGQPATQIDRDAGNLGIGLDSTGTLNNATTNWTANTGGGQPFNLLPPVRAVYIIKRTTRRYFVG